MKVSSDKLEELITLYLDNEASDAELRTLADCVKNDPVAANKLRKSVQIHMATCKIYGKTCRLKNLENFSKKNAPAGKSLILRGLEWTKLAALIMLSFGMLKFTFATDTNNLGESQAASNAFAKLGKIDSYDVNVRKGNNFHMENAFTVIEFSPKARQEFQ